MKGEGVGWYTTRTAPVTIAFPEDKVSCSNCFLFCRYEEAFRRYSCRLTSEPLLHPFAGVGWKCPFFANDNEGVETT